MFAVRYLDGSLAHDGGLGCNLLLLLLVLRVVLLLDIGEAKHVEDQALFFDVLQKDFCDH